MMPAAPDLDGERPLATRLLLGGILAAALALRLWGIGWGLPDARHPLRSYHPDEAVTFEAIGRLRPWPLQLDPGSRWYPSLYYQAHAAWLAAGRAVGAVEIEPSVGFLLEDPSRAARMYRWSRIGSCLAGTAAVLLLFLAARDLYGERAALWTAALAAALPLLVVDAKYVKTDTPMTLGLAAALAAAARHLRTGSTGALAASAAACALAASMKYSAALTLAIPAAAVWLASPPEGRRRAWIRIALVFAAVWIPANAFLLLDLQSELAADVDKPGFLNVFTQALGGDRLLLRTAFEGEPPGWIYLWTDVLWHSCGPAFEAMAAAALLWALRKRSAADRLLLAAWLAHYAVIGASWAQWVRYWMPVAALSCVLAGRLANDLWEAPRFRIVARAAVAAALLYTGAFSLAIGAIYAGSDPRDEASAWIESSLPPGEPVAWLRHPEYAATGRLFPLPPVLYVSAKEEAAGRAPRQPREWLSMEPEALSAPDRARWAAASSYELRDYPRLADRHPREAAFVEGLLAGKGYRVAARFSRRPTILGLGIFPASHPPHDWMYAWPEIWILERTGP